MCFDGPFRSIKTHEVEGPSKHMRFLGPPKHMRAPEGENASGSIKTHEFLGPSKHMRVEEGKGPSKHMRIWVHQNT